VAGVEGHPGTGFYVERSGGDHTHAGQGERVREAYEAARTWAAVHLDQWAATARAEGLAVKTLLRTGIAHEDIVATA